MPSKTGIVFAVCISDKGNVPKYPQEEVGVGQYGLVGDIHAGPTRISRKTNLPKFNDRQISLVALEALEYLNQELGTRLKPGDLGENIITSGLGFLSDIPDGALLKIGNFITVQITEQNVPCKNLLIYHRLLVKKSMGRRGLLGIIKEGGGTKIRPGDSIIVLE